MKINLYCTWQRQQGSYNSQWFSLLEKSLAHMYTAYQTAHVQSVTQSHVLLCSRARHVSHCLLNVAKMEMCIV